MPVPSRFILQQTPLFAALGNTVRNAIVHGGKRSTPTLPGVEVVRTLKPRSRDLVRHYAKLVGGDPSAYKRVLPPHLFSQWAVPFTLEALAGVDLPVQRGLNAGCRMEVHAPLPIDEPLTVRARLEEIDQNERRALIKTRILTGTASVPDALTCYLFVLVPLKGGDKSKKKKRERPRVPSDAKELRFFKVGPTAGLEFAKLTGDFNPIHWVPAYARASGFKNCILHGFATMAYAIEGMNRSMFSGDVHAIRTIDVSFTSPLLLPARVGLYVEGDQLFVGDAPGGRAFLTGTFSTESPLSETNSSDSSGASA